MSSAAIALESSGPVVLFGDFNTHLSVNNNRSELLSQVIQEYNLYSVSTGCFKTMIWAGEVDTSNVDWVCVRNEKPYST